MSTTLNKQSLKLAALAVLFPVASASAQVAWDGNGSPDNSGNWNVPENWNPDGVPSAVATQLNDVSTGTRTVTYNSANPSITTLSMTQTTGGATNALLVDGATLSLTGVGGTPLTQTVGTAISVVNSGAIAFTGNGTKSYTNNGSLTLGDDAGSSGLFRNTAANGPTSVNMTFTNAGVMSLNNQSIFSLNTSGAASGNTFTLTNNASGTINLNGNGTTGLRVGITQTGTNPTLRPTLTNNGTVNVGIATGSTTGITNFGYLHTGSNQRAGALVTNNSIFSVDPDATFVIQGRRTATEVGLATNFNNASAGTFTLGDSGSTSTGGTLSFQVISAGGAGTNANPNMTFTNSGVTTLYGTSAINVGSGTVAAVDGGSLTVNNVGALSVINLHDTSSIGSSNRATLFANAGIVNKIGLGTSNIVSNVSGTASSSGTIDVEAGTLAFSTALTSTGTIKGNGTLEALSIDSSGTIAPGASIGTLGITGPLSITGTGELEIEVDTSAVGQKIDLLNVAGNLDLSGASDALYLSGTLSSGDAYTLVTYSGTRTGEFESVFWSDVLVPAPTAGGLGDSGTYQLVYGDASNGSIQVVIVPEPTAAIAMTLLGLPLLARRRRV